MHLVNYRRLSLEELNELEPQFIRFLAAQSIPSDDWEKIKEKDVERADLLINQFSEMVFDDVIRRISYLEQRGKSQLLTFRCNESTIELRGILVEGESSFDFRVEESPEVMMMRVQASGAKLKIAAAERAYKPSRQQDLFSMLEQGGKIAATSELFDLIDNLTRQSSSTDFNSN